MYVCSIYHDICLPAILVLQVCFCKIGVCSAMIFSIALQMSSIDESIAEITPDNCEKADW